MEPRVNNTPNPFTPEQNATPGRAISRPPAPERGDTPFEVSRKREALRKWYQNRRDALRERRKQAAERKARQSTSGQASFEVMGRWAIGQAVTSESDPTVRIRRRRYLMQRWRTFMRQTFHSGTV